MKINPKKINGKSMKVPSEEGIPQKDVLHIQLVTKEAIAWELLEHFFLTIVSMTTLVMLILRRDIHLHGHHPYQ